MAPGYMLIAHTCLPSRSSSAYLLWPFSQSLWDCCFYLSDSSCFRALTCITVVTSKWWLITSIFFNPCVLELQLTCLPVCLSGCSPSHYHLLPFARSYYSASFITTLQFSASVSFIPTPTTSIPHFLGNKLFFINLNSSLWLGPHYKCNHKECEAYNSSNPNQHKLTN